MEWKTLNRLLWWIETERLVPDTLIHLHLFGEPLMHPRFDEMAARVAQVCPRLSFSTNGILLGERWAKKLSQVNFDYITISPHTLSTKELNERLRLLDEHGLTSNIHGGPDHNWAEQVEHDVLWNAVCEFGRSGKVSVRWNGDVVLCCITDNDQGVIGNVFDEDLDEKEHAAFDLCKSCHLEYGASGQARGLVGNVGRMYQMPT
jgi:MoaA/NifB/PqqE/SkfB family radical SAM enzyme